MNDNEYEEILKEEYNRLIEEVREESIQEIKTFLNMLDINPEAYNFLYDINIEVDFSGKTKLASYEASSNTMYLNSDTIDRVLIYEDEDEMRDLKNSYVHEMIHAIRTITVENGLVITDYIEEKDKEIKKQKPEYKKHNLDQYYDLLNKVLTNDYVKEFKTYIPIKVTNTKDNTYTVIAYNQLTNNFHEFKEQLFNIKTNDNLLYEIGLELNNPEYNHETSYKIETFIPPEKKDDTIDDEYAPISIGADQYYHPFSKSHKLVDDKELEGHTLDEALNKKAIIVVKRTGNAKGFEESISEALSIIIMIAVAKNNLNLDSICEKIINVSDDADTKVAANFIKNMGTEFIKWFLTSTFTDTYDEKLERIFKDKYDIILEKMNNLYKKTLNRTIKIEEEIEANRVIEEITSSIKR